MFDDYISLLLLLLLSRCYSRLQKVSKVQRSFACNFIIFTATTTTAFQSNNKEEKIALLCTGCAPNVCDFVAQGQEAL